MKRAKLPPMRITEPTTSLVVAPAAALRRPEPHVVDVVDGEVRRVDVDARRVLPVVPERHSFPLDYVHEAPMVKRAGGLPIIVEGLVELMPGGRVRFDRPETIPPPVRAVMRALHKREPFYLVIGVGERAWWVELTR